YPSDPVGTPTFAVAGSFFDVQVSNPNGFTSATVQDCDLQGATAVQWWNPTANGGTGAWQPVSPVTATAGPPACLTVTVDANSSPTLSQLTGTVFAGATEVPSAVHIHASATKAHVGERLRVDATVDVKGRHGREPTGTLTFTDNGAIVAGCSNLKVPRSRHVECPLSYPTTTGSPHTVTATYSGDSVYEPASAAVVIIVTKASSTVELRASANPTTMGQVVTFTACVSAAGRHPELSAPTGTVS